MRLSYSLALGVLLLGGCGGSGRGSGRSGRSSAANGTCRAAPIRTGSPPAWTASAWADSSPAIRIPHALAGDGNAAAFFFARALRAGHPTNPANKVLWVMRLPRDGRPLRITATFGADPFLVRHIVRAADSGPGEIYPTYVDLPRPGCWRLALAWAGHHAALDLVVTR